MFYTFIVLFEKSSTLINLMDLCKKFYYKRRKVTNLALTGWGCYNFGIRAKVIRFCRLFKKNIYIIIIKFGDNGKPHSGQVESVFNR
jgi:hypothetical protein